MSNRGALKGDTRSLDYGSYCAWVFSKRYGCLGVVGKV